MKDNHSRAHIVLVLAFCLALTAIWFGKGMLLGSAESGLPFYDLSKYAQINKWAWAYPALGNSTGVHVAGYPTYLFLSIVQKLGIPGFLMEAFVFFTILSAAGLSIYALTRELFPQIKSKFALLAAIFYLFNPFFLINVWNRFLYDYMFFVALLPLGLFIFLKGIRSKKYYFGLILGLTSGIFSYALVSIPFNLLLLFSFTFTTVFYAVFEKEKSRRNFYLKYFVIAIASYALVNFWWISQLVSFVRSSGFSQSTASYFSSQGNLSNLSILSERLGKFIYTSRFFHASAIADKNSPLWLRVYDFFPLTLLEFIISGLIFWTIYKKRQILNVLYLGSLFLIGLFLVKGNQPPFGEIFEFFFLRFGSLQVFRNPFEKFGFFLPLATSPLLAYGLSEVVESTPYKRLAKTLLLGVFGFVLIVWGFPFWTGLLFTLKTEASGGIQRSYQIEVPKYYKEAEKWLEEKGDNFRIVTFPLGQEGITYDWQNPYLGVELTNDLIRTPSISNVTTTPFYETVAKSLEKLLLKNWDIDKILDALNVRYVLLRPDIAWKERGMRNPLVIESALSSSGSGFRKTEEIGRLSLWVNTDWEDRKFYVSENLVGSLPTANISDLSLLDWVPSVALYTGEEVDKLSELVIRPTRKFFLSNNPPSSFDERQDIFPHVNYLPSSRFYSFIIFKEKLENMLFNKNLAKRAESQVSLLGKRLNEAKISNEKGDFSGVVKTLSLYEYQLDDFKKLIVELNRGVGLDNEGRAWKQEELYMKFARHKGVLEDIALSGDSNAKQKAQETRALLDGTLSSLGISPTFGYKESQSFLIEMRVSYQFIAPEDNDYELFIDAKNWKSFYDIDPNYPILFQIDKELIQTQGRVSENGLVSFGKYRFSKGIHEIGLNTPKQVNLLDAPAEFQMKVEHGVENKLFEIKNYDPFSKYEISFDYRIVRGSGLVFLFENDNNSVIENKIQPSFARFFGPDDYDFDFQRYSVSIGPYSGSSSGKVDIRVEPWNDCEKIYQRNKSRCKDDAFASRYDRNTQVIIKNLEVKRVLTDDALLVAPRKLTRSTGSLPQINYQKINPTLYRVKVAEATGKFNLIFSELYSSGWQARFSDGTTVSEDKHFLANAFANGWEIDKAGDYEVEVKFTPQDILSKAKIISLISFVAAAVILVILKLKENNIG